MRGNVGFTVVVNRESLLVLSTEYSLWDWAGKPGRGRGGRGRVTNDENMLYEKNIALPKIKVLSKQFA